MYGRLLRYVAIGALGALVVCALAACGRNPPVGSGPTDLHFARSFHDFPLYFAGPRVNHLPLTWADTGDYYEPGKFIDFLYGTCEPDGENDSCQAPLQIHNSSVCRVYPSLYGPRRSKHFVMVRRAPALLMIDADGGAKLEIYTARTTVSVSGTSRAIVMAVAQELRQLNGPIRARAPLTPLDAASLHRKPLRCHRT